MRWVRTSSNVLSRRRRWSGRAMRSRSAPGSSTPTSRLTSRLHGPLLLAIVVVLIPLAGFYVIEAFLASNPLLRIELRSLPVLPVAIWTLWFETSRPLERQRPLIRVAGRIALLVLVMAFAVAILGIGLNWLYDPNRFIQPRMAA